MRKGYWKDWLKAAGIRALKTYAQTATATIGATAVMEEVNWLAVLSASVLAALLSLLTSLAGLPEVDGSDAEFTEQIGEALEEGLAEISDENIINELSNGRGDE